VRPVTVVIFFLGIFAGIAAPIFRQYGKAGIVLAGGAAMLVIVAVTGLLHQDMRDGLATVEANRREYRLMLQCEIPVMTLAPASLHWQKKLFWVGWAIHAASRSSWQ
jgi:cobalamin synthase